MRNFRRLAFFVAALLVALVIVLFVLENNQPATLLFLGWPAPELPVSICVLLALLAGMMLGPFLSWFMGKSRLLK
ncbi:MULTISPECIES: lipopolysaccharide assembly protein LapA domain-containing protein [unclassified Pseudomonas]|uniref:lipopolysaccharide assembly protein LapA domain-containing protein n=1 Tax=unclassified Pseudomonas TaxID=196821 RepID=UPI000922EE00|nr:MULTISPECIES: lipopolysaccharide assembly protein LapA domain-containing protein [unclassified Pseudomonas]SFX01014.1 Protein of unknown function [Pseudomonas sp. NFACC47-1]SFX21711.1 Protein of unknown function [Pseudomonas sp. NFACC43]